MPKPIGDEFRTKNLASLAYWRDREEWSDQHILSDMCDQFRAEAKAQADIIARNMAADEAVEGAIKATGSEIG